jgi:hypothetical protein
MAITPIAVTRQLTKSAPVRAITPVVPVSVQQPAKTIMPVSSATDTQVSARGTTTQPALSVVPVKIQSPVKTIMPVMPVTDSQISITGGQSAPVTVIGATRKLTASLPTTPIQITPFSPAKSIMPVMPVQPVMPTRPIMDSSYAVPGKTQSTTTVVPSVIVAEKAAAQQILTKDIPRLILEKTLPVIPDMTVTGRPSNQIDPVMAKKDVSPVMTIMPAKIIPSSDIPKKILPVKVTDPVSPILTNQPRTKLPAPGTPINPAIQLTPETFTPMQPSACTAAMMSAGLCAGTVTPTPSRLALPAPTPTPTPTPFSPAPVQDSGVMTSFAPLLDPGISAQDDMTTPGVTPPDFMRVRGREERYYGREPFVETNVITPQVSMPTQVSTQAPAQSYQVPIDQGYDPNKIQYTPGTTSYIGGQAQPGASAPIDSAYNTIKILTLAGVGLGALYWLISKAAPKVEFKSNRKNRKRTRR